jgi:hypothetical protein
MSVMRRPRLGARELGQDDVVRGADLGEAGSDQLRPGPVGHEPHEPAGQRRQPGRGDVETSQEDGLDAEEVGREACGGLAA